MNKWKLTRKEKTKKLNFNLAEILKKSLKNRAN